MREQELRIERGVWIALTLGISACAPAIRAHSEPATDPRGEPHFEDTVDWTNADEPPAVVSVAPPEFAPAPAQAAPSALQGSELRASEPRSGVAPESVLAQAPTPAAAVLPSAGLIAKPAAKPTEFLVLDRGEGNVPLMIPRNEQLVFEVHLNLGWLGSPTVGKVTITSGVRPYYSAVPGQPAGEQAQISGRAEGSYSVYTLDNTISSQLLPQLWPRTIHRNVQTGTENRARELMLGVVDGKQVSRYRHDTHCKGCNDKAHFVSGTWPWSKAEHCDKCKLAEHRVWKDPATRAVPEGTLDMVTAVFLARSLVIDGRSRIEFPLIDTDELWQVQLTRGRTKRVETTAGKFNVVEVELRTGPPEGTAPGKAAQFEGLFGIHGAISIWMDAVSGVPVEIEGAVPAGPIDLNVTIELHSFRGTPRAFTALRE